MDKQKVEVLMHLGDDYDEAVILGELGVGIIWFLVFSANIIKTMRFRIEWSKP